MDRYLSSAIEFNPDSLDTIRIWWQSRTVSQKSVLQQSFDRFTRDADRYASSVKADVKPKLDMGHLFELPAGQIITASDAVLASELAGVTKSVADRLKFCLKSKYAIADGLNQSELSGHMNSILLSAKECSFAEVDFGKFDKSQDDMTLALTVRIMKFFGMSNTKAETYRSNHIINRLSFSKLGFSLKTQYQRRSGEPFTLLGNTIVSMLVMSFIYDLELSYGGIFVGDDSLIALSNLNSKFVRIQDTAEIFNLVSKLVSKSTAPMFTNRFLVFVKGSWLFVADPLKIITRLGRDDMYCKQHIELCYVSYCDNCKLYKDKSVRDALVKAMLLRYHTTLAVTPVNATNIVNFLAGLTYSVDRFTSCYYAKPNIWSRSMPSNMVASVEKNMMHLVTDDMEDMIDYL